MAAPPRIALDSGALIALAHGNVDARAHLRRWVSEGSAVLVPVPVLAETLRGSARDASVERILNREGIQFISVSQSAARRAGCLLGAAKLPASETMDALIVATALEGGATDIITSDSRQFRSLAGIAANIIELRSIV